jgi:hypothetical protein
VPDYFPYKDEAALTAAIERTTEYFTLHPPPERETLYGRFTKIAHPKSFVDNLVTAMEKYKRDLPFLINTVSTLEFLMNAGITDTGQDDKGSGEARMDSDEAHTNKFKRRSRPTTNATRQGAFY